MSYDALGRRDALPNMFHQINSKIGKYNDTAGQYSIKNLQPLVYYNDHHQK